MGSFRFSHLGELRIEINLVFIPSSSREYRKKKGGGNSTNNTPLTPPRAQITECGMNLFLRKSLEDFAMKNSDLLVWCRDKKRTKNELVLACNKLGVNFTSDKVADLHAVLDAHLSALKPNDKATWDPNAPLPPTPATLQEMWTRLIVGWIALLPVVAELMVWHGLGSTDLTKSIWVTVVLVLAIVVAVVFYIILDRADKIRDAVAWNIIWINAGGLLAVWHGLGLPDIAKALIVTVVLAVNFVLNLRAYFKLSS